MAIGVILLSKLKENYDTDHFHPKLANIYRIITKEIVDAKQSQYASSPLPIKGELNKLSFVEKTAIVRFGSNANVQTENGDIPIELTFSEPNFFHVFGFKLQNGNATSLAKSLNAIILSKDMAEKIFGTTNPIGKELKLEKYGTFVVSDVINTPPLASHLKIDAMLSLDAATAFEKRGLLDTQSNSWNEFENAYTYALLNEDNDKKQLDNSLSALSRQWDKTKLEFSSQRLDDITPTDANITNERNPGMSANAKLMLLFLLISLTALAAFNYISLSLARAVSRSSEIGIRKTAGATRSQIVIQFLFESIIIATFSLLLTIPLVSVLLKTVPDLNLIFKIDIVLVLCFLGYAIFTGLMAGLIPAWLLSSFQPIHILKKMKNVNILKGANLYKSLIVIQFAVTIMLMAFFVILINYEKNSSKNLAENIPSNILRIDGKGESIKDLQNEIENLSNVEEVYPTNWFHIPYKIDKCILKVDGKSQTISYTSIDPKVIDREHLTLKAGKNFPTDQPKTIEQYVLVNEKVARYIGATYNDVIGKTVEVDSINMQVIGILSSNLSGPKIPTVYRYLPNEISSLTVKVKSGSEKDVQVSCIKIWNSHFPHKTCNIVNLRDSIDGQNTKEAVGFFAFFAILILIISCLGILGIASYAVEIRTKELGIRKVLGAGELLLIWTVTRNFALLILIGGLIGIPAGYYCGNLLRDRMGSQVDLGPTNFALGFGIVAIAGLLAVISQTYSAASIDTAKVLKSDK